MRDVFEIKYWIFGLRDFRNYLYCCGKMFRILGWNISKIVFFFVVFMGRIRFFIFFFIELWEEKFY